MNDMTPTPGVELESGTMSEERLVTYALERAQRHGGIGRSMTEVLADARLELVGPLPAEIQSYTLYAAGVIAASKSQDAAKALIAFLASPAAQAVMKSKGFEQLCFVLALHLGVLCNKFELI